MFFSHRLFSLFLILQQFISIAWSQGASSTAPSSSTFPLTSSGGNGSTTTGTISTASVTANSTGLTTSASTTSTAPFPSLSGVSLCVSNCLAQASSDLGCSSEVDVNCFCVNTDYPAQLLDCVLGNCPDQVSVIESIGQQFCNQASGQPTLSFFPVPTTTATATSVSPLTSTSTSTSSVPTSSATTTSNAAFSWKSISGSTDVMRLGAIMAFGVFLGV